MALLFADSFGETALTNKYASVLGGSNPIGQLSTSGRRGGYCMYVKSSWVQGHWVGTKLLTSSTTMIFGIAYKADLIDTQMSFCTFYYGSTKHVDLVINSNGTLTARSYESSTATNIGTSSSALLAGHWYYIEMKATIHSSTGYVEVRIDEVPEITYTGKTRNGSTTADTNYIYFGGNKYQSDESLYYMYDDLYICNSSGTTCNDFLGDQRIDLIVPSGAGYQTDWTPNTAVANYTTVDEVLSSTSDYVSDTTVGHIDSYAYGDLPTGPPSIATIRGVYQSIIAKRSDTGVTASIVPFVRISGTNYEGSTLDLLDTYTNYYYIWETNPAEVPGTLWTTAAVNGAEFGYRVVSV